MSRRHFDATENAELRAKIDQAKQRLPLPEVMKRLGLAEHAKKSARCPFHSDEHPSFSVFHSKEGKGWQWKCHVGCGYGDEIAFLVRHLGFSRREAIKRYLEMAGFPSSRPPKSHEYPKPPESHKSPDCPVFPLSPMSNGQGLDKELKALAVRNACTQCKTAKRGLWQAARDVRAMEKRIGRKLSNGELMMVFDEWHRLSEPFLDPRVIRDEYLAAFLAKPAKVRFPTGEGDTLNRALATVARLSPDDLPAIPGIANAPESWRRLAALHRELSRLCADGKYFLSYRGAATAYDGLSPQSAHNITAALARLGVIKILRKGKAGLNGGKAAEFRYLLLETEGVEDNDEIPF